MELAQSAAVLTGLFLNSIFDIKRKEISLKITLIYGVCGVILRLVDGFDGKDFLLALFPGIICMILAYVSREQIGCGDAWILLATGCCIPSTDIVLVCLFALSATGAAALFLYVVLHKKGTFEMPFVPFLFVSTLCVRGIGL
jgi:leader peptidase (prepilin peptidase)/N-methyltransferase